MNSSPVVLVTGGAGYIGSHVVYELRRQRFIPVVVDNLSTGHRWACKYGPLEVGDIGDEEFIRGVCAKYLPAACIHLAAYSDVAESIKEPEKYFVNNVRNAAIFFGTLAACGVDKLVFSSTAAVYGAPNCARFIDERTDPEPINPYGDSKLRAEKYLRATLGLRSVALRYFNVGGAACDSGLGECHIPETHLIPRLLLPLMSLPSDVQSAVNKGGKFTVYGTDYATVDGTATRDYVHVEDLARAHVSALGYLFGGGKNTIINLGSGRGYSVREVVESAKHVLDLLDYMPVMGPRRAGDPAKLVACISRAQELLNWAPTKTLNDIIMDAAVWHGSIAYIEAVRNAVQSKCRPSCI